MLDAAASQRFKQMVRVRPACRHPTQRTRSPELALEVLSP